jgi:hypothetical protein
MEEKCNSHETKCKGSKIVTSGHVEQEIAEQIKNVAKTCQICMNTFWKWEVLRIRKLF